MSTGAKAQKTSRSATVWQLSQLVKRLPGGRLMVRRDGRGRIIEALYVVPQHASEVEPGVPAHVQVMRWASRVTHLKTKDERRPLRASVAFYRGSELGGWDELTLKAKAELGL